MSRLILATSLAALLWVLSLTAYVTGTLLTGRPLSLGWLAIAWPVALVLWVLVYRALARPRVVAFLTWAGVIR